MSRFLPLLLLALGLTTAACDSNEEADPEDFIGLWNVDETSSRVLATVSEAQQIIDQTRPGQGGIQVAGAETGTLRYLGYSSGSDDEQSLWISSYDFRGDEPPYPWLGLYLSSTGNAELTVEEADDYRSYALTTGETIYTFTDNVLTVQNATLTDGTSSVTVSGSLTFATRSLPANQETEIDVYTESDEDDFRLEFAENGILRTHDDDGSETGTWEIVGDQLRLEFDDEDSVLVSYQIDGNTLSMSYIEDGCDEEEDGDGCLRYYEQTYGFEAETLTRLRYEENITLTRATGSVRPSAGTQARSGRSDHADARLWTARPAQPAPQR